MFSSWSNDTNVILSLTDRGNISPSFFLSSDKYAIPLLIASFGHLISTSLPSISIVPEVFLYSPKITFAVSDLPAPIRPAIPRISPALTSKLTFLRTPSKQISFNFNNGFIFFGITYGY